MDKKLLYYTGMAAGIAYLLGDIIGGIITPNYSYTANAVSELVQSGAENRIFISSFLFIHAVMIILFAIGIILHHPYKKVKLVFIGGIIFMVIGISHSLSSSIFPQDPVGDPFTFAGTMHLILVAIAVVLIFFLLPMIGQGLYRYKNWKSFRSFSFICLPIMIIFGALTPYMVTKGLMGVAERVVGYTFYIWISFLAYQLIKEQPENEEHGDDTEGG